MPRRWLGEPSQLARLHAKMGESSPSEPGSPSIKRLSMPLRIWSEFLPYEQLASPAVISLLRQHGVMLCLSVPAGKLGAPLAQALHTCADAGIPVAWWALLPEATGYWPSEGNVQAFANQVDRVLEWSNSQRLPLEWLAVDLEMPLPQVRAFRAAQGWRKLPVMLKIAHQNLTPTRYQGAVEQYRALQSRLESHGVKTLCAALDLVLLDLPGAAPVIQDLFETPVLDVPWNVVSFMLYNTLTAQLFGVTVPDARWLQYQLCLEIKDRLGARGAVSLGLTGIGVLGDEPFYASPKELEPDVAAARAAGLDDLALYNLEGILQSSDPAGWLVMLRDTGPAIPPETPWAARTRARRQRLLQGLTQFRRYRSWREHRQG